MQYAVAPLCHSPGVMCHMRCVAFTFCLQTDKGFDKNTFEKQMSVMRGQVGWSVPVSSGQFRSVQHGRSVSLVTSVSPVQSSKSGFLWSVRLVSSDQSWSLSCGQSNFSIISV